MPQKRQQYNMYTNSGAKYENEAMEMDGFFHLPTFEIFLWKDLVRKWVS
jgi:hypothetical protein